MLCFRNRIFSTTGKEFLVIFSLSHDFLSTREEEVSLHFLFSFFLEFGLWSFHMLKEVILLLPTFAITYSWRAFLQIRRMYSLKLFFVHATSSYRNANIENLVFPKFIKTNQRLAVTIKINSAVSHTINEWLIWFISNI